MVACKAMSSGEEQDAKAEQQATQMYLHEKILGVVVAGIAFAIIADKIGSTHLLGCFLAGVVATAWKDFAHIWEPMDDHGILLLHCRICSPSVRPGCQGLGFGGCHRA